jgi:hypothetical protein
MQIQAVLITLALLCACSTTLAGHLFSPLEWTIWGVACRAVLAVGFVQVTGWALKLRMNCYQAVGATATTAAAFAGEGVFLAMYQQKVRAGQLAGLALLILGVYLLLPRHPKDENNDRD